MKFYNNQLFHIYNQGNNQQQIFFSPDNYEYFLWKMRAYLLPFGDIICWCLMPNHFHWLFYVKEREIMRKDLWASVDEVEKIRRIKEYGSNAKSLTKSRRTKPESNITLNESIGMIERTYTRAINKMKNQSGSLFRKECKAKDGWIDEFVTLKHKNGKEDYRFWVGNNYGFHCLNYIHNNPVEANLVTIPTEYVYSSARDYTNKWKGTLCYLDFGKQLLGYS